ncbi:hypothetical protein B0T17DRAFT_270990 [Bombardia bombarda]|uniref:Uncharacterized protein n=1 Tax=Bombardia bombarda TaxID=252184 RepID=A0AA39X164_9PEZI|nr:hypothetical protein B0T17DRAFT_270990 [Bombardia bombarda]
MRRQRRSSVCLYYISFFRAFFAMSLCQSIIYSTGMSYPACLPACLPLTHRVECAKCSSHMVERGITDNSIHEPRNMLVDA